MKSQQTYKHQAPLGYLIHEVARLMKRRFEEEAKIHGITLPQWRVLGQIAMNEGITQVQIATATEIDPMTVSGVLDRLDKRGLIDRYADPTDSRAKLARLTAEGEALYTTARKVGLAMYEASLEGVTEDEREALIGVLSRMRINLSGQSAELEEV